MEIDKKKNERKKQVLMAVATGIDKKKMNMKEAGG